MDPYFSQVEKKIYRLVADKRFQDAYSEAKQLVSKYLGDDDAVKILKMVERAVVQNNKDIVKSKLKGLKDDYKDGNYVSVIKDSRKLLKLVPDDSTLKALLEKSRRAYEKEVRRKSIELIARNRAGFDKLLKESPSLLNQRLFEFDRNNPGNPAVKKLTDEFRDKLIEKKIAEKEDLIY